MSSPSPGVAFVMLNTDYQLADLGAAVSSSCSWAPPLFGALNAAIVVRAGVPSIITTLGTGTLIYGAASGWAGTAPRGGVDQDFTDLVSWLILGAPLAIYITFGWPRRLLRRLSTRRPAAASSSPGRTWRSRVSPASASRGCAPRR